MLNLIKLDIVAAASFIASYLTEIMQVVFISLSIISVALSIVYKYYKLKKLNK